MIERKFIAEGITNARIAEYLENKLKRANVVNVNVQKTALVSRITIEAEKPGMIIGKKGTSIQSLTDDIEKLFGLSQPQIEVKPLTDKPELNGIVVAKRIAGQIEQGIMPKQILNKTIMQTMNAGAQGIEIIIKGALAGKGGSAQKIAQIDGYVKKVGDLRHLLSVGRAVAKTKKGTIGITVRIVPPHIKFIDKEDIRVFLPKAAETVQTIGEAVGAPAEPVKATEPAPEPLKEKTEPEKKPEAEEKPKKPRAKKKEATEKKE